MLDLARKTPIQARARQTVDTLLDAAAQLLEREGEAAFNTNRIAEAAGFSIGTLYQYFPDKRAIAAALVARESARVEAQLRRAYARAEPGDLPAAMRILVRSCIDLFGRQRRARRLLMLQLIRLGIAEHVVQAIDPPTRAVTAALRDSRIAGMRPLSDAGAFVLTRAILGTVRAAVLEDSPHVGTQAFEDELVHMALAFIRMPEPKGAGPVSEGLSTRQFDKAS